MRNPYEDKLAFGDFMLKLRKKYGWTRKQVKVFLGYKSETTVMNYETGHTRMDADKIYLFGQATPERLSVPLIYSMFEAETVETPCLCPCHQDMNNSIPGIYAKDGSCTTCGHGDTDCTIINGLWFEEVD